MSETHYEGCERAPGHHGCAIAKLDAVLLDSQRLDRLEENRELIVHIRRGRNRIGVETGGWLVCKTFDGPEEHVRTFREAVDLACQALGIAAARAQP